MSSEETEAVPATPDAVAVLVVSCDAYRDLWRPFFELFWRHWPDCPYPVCLGSERRTLDDPRVRRLDVGVHPDWSAAWCGMLERIAEPTTLVLLEDYLFYARVSSQAALWDTRVLRDLWLRDAVSLCRAQGCPSICAPGDASRSLRSSAVLCGSASRAAGSPPAGSRHRSAAFEH